MGPAISSLMKIRSVDVRLYDSNCGHKLLSSIKYCNISTEACSCYNERERRREREKERERDSLSSRI